jgi:ankyrin repeat protein
MPSRLPAVLLAGADLKHTDDAGNTSVWLAMQHKHEAAVEVLLQAMIAAGMDIDARYEGWDKQGQTRYEGWDKQGQTLLMRASALGLTRPVAKLLALGADIAAKDAVRGNVLSLARSLSLARALFLSLSLSPDVCMRGF